MSREEVATLAGGCFWCLEAVFKGVKGVSESAFRIIPEGRKPIPLMRKSAAIKQDMQKPSI